MCRSAGLPRACWHHRCVHCVRWVGLVPWLFLGLGREAWAADEVFETVVRADRSDRLPAGAARTVISASELEARQPRSAPDALRYEPGVFVQQSAHGQGSAFIRGLTGQQTLLLFDGIRLNNSTFRQGPNQYFFTVDSRSISSIEILRGGGSTLFGSDAMGGIIQALPIEASLPPLPSSLSFQPLLLFRGGSADGELGGRAELRLTWRKRSALGLSFVGGVGGRAVGQLQSGGRLENLDPNTSLGRYPQVPRYLPDGRTQVGTGFRELTIDGRLVLALGSRHRLTLASYHYLQFDVPRTDQCPPPTAPIGTCLTYEQQLRHLSYLAWESALEGPLDRVRVTLSYQQQHEQQRYDDPSVLAVYGGIDDVSTIGLTALLRSRRAVLSRHTALAFRVGFDLYSDWLSSSATRRYTDTPGTAVLPRGQYVDGSTYLQTGSYVDAELRLPAQLVLRAGGRLAYTQARVGPSDSMSTQALSQSWFPLVGRLGVEWRPWKVLTLRSNVDHSYRTPNLNDLTARQQTGPGFQFENPALRPERATTLELGVLLAHRILSAELWAFETLLDDAVLKVARSLEDCPAATPQCQGSWTRFQLQNAPARTELRGVESLLRIQLLKGLSLRGTLTYTWGEGPRVGSLGQGVYGVMLNERVPLSRIPPLNGTAELRFRPLRGLLVGTALRWAAAQDRLAPSDLSDARIPSGGTPGFVVFDVRAGIRLHELLPLLGTGRWLRRGVAMLVLENAGDVAYRYHGSSVNGARSSVQLNLELEI